MANSTQQRAEQGHSYPLTTAGTSRALHRATPHLQSSVALPRQRQDTAKRSSLARFSRAASHHLLRLPVRFAPPLEDAVDVEYTSTMVDREKWINACIENRSIFSAYCELYHRKGCASCTSTSLSSRCERARKRASPSKSSKQAPPSPHPVDLKQLHHLAPSTHYLARKRIHQASAHQAQSSALTPINPLSPPSPLPPQPQQAQQAPGQPKTAKAKGQAKAKARGKGRASPEAPLRVKPRLTLRPPASQSPTPSPGPRS